MFGNISEELRRAEKETGDGDRLVLDTYVPADGTYVLVDSHGQVRSYTIKMDKKKKNCGTKSRGQRSAKENCFYDYHSRLVSMDKPQDPKKVIHSNNYLSFWVKQESLENGKLDEAAIDRYFDVLRNPREKYKNRRIVRCMITL